MKLTEAPGGLWREARPASASCSWRGVLVGASAGALVARTVDWDEVLDSHRGAAGRSVLLAALVACHQPPVYSLLRPGGPPLHRPPPVARGTVMQVSFTSYAFNLNLGSLVGGIGFRYRLYSRAGLGPDRSRASSR
jgi:uncharacterized membrane protein YbhN (UPF0104 family)